MDWGQVRGYAVLGYGVIFLAYALWLLWRGGHERPWWRPIPGRLVFGAFLLCAAYWCLDVSYARLIAPSTTAVNDAASTIPFVAGLGFGVWGFLRFLRNDLEARNADR